MRKLILYSLIISVAPSIAQPGDQVFNDTVMHRLEIESGLPDWQDTLDADYQAGAKIFGHPQRWFRCKVFFDGTVLEGCGFREKGNASNFFTNAGKKKPLKISFDEFRDGQLLDGLKKININNFTNDPSLLHDVISFKLMRDLVGVAPRTAFTEVWIDGEYIGLYLIIENVDKTFLKIHYESANNDGNLYKTDRNAKIYLDWLGESSDAYRLKNFTLQTNEAANDWTKFIQFVYFINHYREPDFFSRLEKMFDVHSYLKILAVEKCVKSWDSYWGGGNNFHLYEHPDGMIRWIPWDMNESFQDLKMLNGTSVLSGYLIPTPQLDERPLLKRIFENTEWRKEYLNNVCHLVNSEFTPAHLGRYIFERHRLIDPVYYKDPNKINSYPSFQRSLTETNEDVVSFTKSGNAFRLRYPGIFPLIREQREWAVDQIRAWDLNCSLEDKANYQLHVFPNPAQEFLHIENSHSVMDLAEFRLYDNTGALALTTPMQLVQQNEFTMDVRAVPSGIYLLLKISADGSIGRAKVIVQ